MNKNHEFPTVREKKKSSKCRKSVLFWLVLPFLGISCGQVLAQNRVNVPMKEPLWIVLDKDWPEFPQIYPGIPSLCKIFCLLIILKQVLSEEFVIEAKFSSKSVYKKRRFNYQDQSQAKMRQTAISCWLTWDFLFKLIWNTYFAMFLQKWNYQVEILDLHHQQTFWHFWWFSDLFSLENLRGVSVCSPSLTIDNE